MISRSARKPVCLAILFAFLAAPAWRRLDAADFLRGDIDGDGIVDVSDPIALLSQLFLEGPATPCLDAADANDDGKVGSEDAVAVLLHLFLNGFDIPAPGPALSGPDPTCDGLDCSNGPPAPPAILFTEILYHSNRGYTYDFVEIHNRTTSEIGLGGYRFTNGIEYEFPADARLGAGEYAVVAKDLNKWRAVRAFGPYAGQLADDGERVTLAGDCSQETVRYDDRFPWPLGPDGYGRSLERIDFNAPTDDHHSWRASTIAQGSPGKASSSSGAFGDPFLFSTEISPVQPRSSDAVTVTVGFDAALGSIRAVTLRVKKAGDASPVQETAMRDATGNGGLLYYSALLPPQPSQTLHRFNIQAELSDGRMLLFPGSAEPAPFFSYLVYDFEIEHLLPMLWLIPSYATKLYEKDITVSGAAIVEPGSGTLQLFDGAQLRSSNNGKKLRFLKGMEYRGDRTINILPEMSNPATGGGGRGTYVEQLGLQTFRDAGARTPRADWFRVIEFRSVPEAHLHSQRVVIQQVNENFLQLNGIGDAGDLYKFDKEVMTKKTNLETGARTGQDLSRSLTDRNAAQLSEFLFSHVDLDAVGLYSAASVFMSNWDGFHNNIYFYNDLTPAGLWMVFPWDLDQVFEPAHVRLPLNFPLTGRSDSVSRNPGLFSKPYHGIAELDARYRTLLGSLIQPEGLLGPPAMEARIAAKEALLLGDLDSLERYLGAAQASRRGQILSAYGSVRTFLNQRYPYLRSQLGDP